MINKYLSIELRLAEILQNICDFSEIKTYEFIILKIGDELVKMGYELVGNELVKIGNELEKLGYELVGNELVKVRVDLYPLYPLLQ